jgi:hypothetical protein
MTRSWSAGTFTIVGVDSERSAEGLLSPPWAIEIEEVERGRSCAVVVHLVTGWTVVKLVSPVRGFGSPNAATARAIKFIAAADELADWTELVPWDEEPLRTRLAQIVRRRLCNLRPDLRVIEGGKTEIALDRRWGGL